MIEIADRLRSVKEYYFSSKLQEIAHMRSEGKNILNLGVGSPDLPPSDSTIEILKHEAGKPDQHAYQSYRSSAELRESISDFYKSLYKVQLNSESEVLPLLGSKEGVMYISMAFLNPGDEVLVPNPGYPAYGAIAKLLGVNVRTYDLLEENNWEPDFETLESLNLNKVKLMWVNYPNMPTGAPASVQLFERLVDFAACRNILLVNDNPYSQVLNDFPISILSADKTKEHVLELNSMSKGFNMSGWRVGMVLGHSTYINAVLQAKSNVDSGMFLPVQKAAAHALQLPEEWHIERNSVYKERRKFGLELLEELECTIASDQVGMFLWAKVPAFVEKTHMFVDELLHEAHVFLTPGDVFGSNGERYVRLSLCSPIEDYEEAIKRIEKWKQRERQLV